MNISELYGRKPKAGEIGIELEVEFKPGTPIPVEIGGVWIAKPEGSINHGMEYVTRNPIKADGLKRPRLKRLVEQLHAEPYVPAPISNRTSMHVHINIDMYLPRQVWAAAVCYWLIENALMLACGVKNRVSNHFCLRIADAPQLIQAAKTDIAGTLPFSTFHPDGYKYSGQNLATVRTIGSLEYRGMEGTLDVDRMDDWSSALAHMVKMAAAIGDPERILNMFLTMPKDSFLSAFLPASFVEKLKSFNTDLIGLCRPNAKLIAPLVFMNDDWPAWDQKMHDKAVERAEATKNKGKNIPHGLTASTWAVMSAGGTLTLNSNIFNDYED